jgi:hypothetical protein
MIKIVDVKWLRHLLPTGELINEKNTTTINISKKLKIKKGRSRGEIYLSNLFP